MGRFYIVFEVLLYQFLGHLVCEANIPILDDHDTLLQGVKYLLILVFLTLLCDRLKHFYVLDLVNTEAESDECDRAHYQRDWDLIMDFKSIYLLQGKCNHKHGRNSNEELSDRKEHARPLPLNEIANHDGIEY